MTTATPAKTRRPASRYERVRRLVYHMLGGEGHNDPWVKVIDYALVALISLNCVFSVLETVERLAIVHGEIFHIFDICSVLVFSIEYLLRIWTAVEMEDPRFRDPLFGRLRYLVTPLALVDLLAIAPFYLGIFFEFDFRAVRVLRLLRVFKLTRYSQAMNIMASVLRQESRAIGAVLFVFIVILVFVSSLMYMLEHPAQPHVFSDVPSAMWWAVVTMSTLGYGDMVPVTNLGRVLGGCTALVGVGMIALPAGVLASGFSEQLRLRREEYAETVEKVVHGGRVTPRRRRILEETRQTLGLSHEEASNILEHVVKSGGLICPHCDKPIDLRHKDGGSV